MKKFFFIFLLVAVLGSTFFLFPAVSADTVSAPSESSNLTWTHSFEKEVNTMGFTAGQPYNINLDTSLPYGDNFDYQLSTQDTVTVYGFYYNYQTSGITASTNFYIPVCYWEVSVGGSIDFTSAIHINQSTEWYRQMMLSSSSDLDSFEVYNSSGESVSQDSWTVPKDYQTFFIMVYFDGISHPFLNEFLQRKFWSTIVSVNFGAGLISGKDYGYDLGYNDGEKDGYQQGYDVGLAEGTPTSTLDALVSGVSNILRIPLFGNFTLGAFISIIIGIGLLFLFLKIFAGG